MSVLKIWYKSGFTWCDAINSLLHIKRSLAIPLAKNYFAPLWLYPQHSLHIPQLHNLPSAAVLHSRCPPPPSAAVICRRTQTVAQDLCHCPPPLGPVSIVVHRCDLLKSLGTHIARSPHYHVLGPSLICLSPQVSLATEYLASCEYSIDYHFHTVSLEEHHQNSTHKSREHIAAS
jgi:hypothetical protein